MTRFVHAEARGDDWREVVRVCGDRLAAGGAKGALGFVYVTETLGRHLADITQTLRARLGVPQWVGCSGFGIVAGGAEIYDGGALSVVVAPFAADLVAAVPTVLDAERAAGAGAGRWPADRGPVFGVFHADPRNGQIEDILRAFNDNARAGAFVVGGLTPLSEHPVQVAGASSAAGGVSGVLLSRDIPVAVTMSQGCLPVGPYRTVSGARRGIVAELDGRSALDALKEDVGEVLARDLNRIAGYIHVALPVGGSDTRAYTVRNLMGVDPRAGMIAVGADVGVGDRLMFVRRDPASAQKDFARSLEDLKKRVGDRRILGGHYVSCVARGRNMFGQAGGEVGMICDTLGPFPLTGFFANGEICGGRLYGYTGVLTVFLDRP